MRKIVFKNGKEIKVSQAAVDAIASQILKGAKKFQIFSDDDSAKNTTLIINLEEISYVQ